MRYSDSSRHVKQIKTADGKVLRDECDVPISLVRLCAFEYAVRIRALKKSRILDCAADKKHWQRYSNPRAFPPPVLKR